MEFAGLGAIMLILVLIVYLRMIEARMKQRNRGDRSEALILEQADMLESFGKPEDAIRLLEKALVEKPESTAIRARLELLRAESEE
ncbi:tetratricopeptide repeat protein [Saccharospirillum salsuginis]|uniref:Tetratricopeptide repeat protein n=1 Tax=Saccharospirillum salsuginis TaxID=418750 RepID=A0A918NJ54_9GAMM|nr:tetratricopeptide repeat protein [Saccharospirillum salsuginis]GGX71490.1 hypothetical protein GCM10007392_43770 [Saccharospirillum salsuginis]